MDLKLLNAKDSLTITYHCELSSPHRPQPHKKPSASFSFRIFTPSQILQIKCSKVRFVCMRRRKTQYQYCRGGSASTIRSESRCLGICWAPCGRGPDTPPTASASGISASARPTTRLKVNLWQAGAIMRIRAYMLDLLNIENVHKFISNEKKRKKSLIIHI